LRMCFAQTELSCEWREVMVGLQGSQTQLNAPCGDQRVKDLQNSRPSKAGRLARYRALSLVPPAITVSCPRCAMGALPDSGASSQPAPQRARRTAPSGRADRRSIEDMSRRRDCGAMHAAAPRSPNTAVRTMATEFSLVMTKSAPFAASAAVSAALARIARNGAGLASSRPQTRKSWPHPAMRRAIAPPVMPMSGTATHARLGGSHEPAPRREAASPQEWRR